MLVFAIVVVMGSVSVTTSIAKGSAPSTSALPQLGRARKDTAVAPPRIYDLSTPTEPGSTLLVSGSGLAHATITICDISRVGSSWPCTNLTAVQPWDLSIKATLPRVPLAYVGSIAVATHAGAATAVFNAPALHWHLASGLSTQDTSNHGETDMAMVQGAMVRLLGTSLAWDTAASNCPPVGMSQASTAVVTLVSTATGECMCRVLDRSC